MTEGNKNIFFPIINETCFPCIKNRIIFLTKIHNPCQQVLNVKLTFSLWSSTHSDDWHYWPKYLLLHYHSIFRNTQYDSWGNFSCSMPMCEWEHIKKMIYSFKCSSVLSRFQKDFTLQISSSVSMCCLSSLFLLFP